ncbi:MAG: SDR family oxidoreductase [Alphaproteobacteria bacterium]|nr:SDR family oxidoreductase [Alphaproteobacteria bacterium]
MTNTQSGATPRRALVTGASRGIGREIALTLARNGFDLAVTAREIDRLDDVMSQPEMAGVNAIPIAVELTSHDSINQGFDTAVEGLGGLDVLINNAGRALIKPAIDVTWEDWDSVVDANLKGAYFLSGRLARHCIDANRPGAIVNIASTHGLTGLAGRTVYGISKGGMIQMARMLAIEWAEQAIRVNSVALSTVMTESRQEMLKDPEVRARMLGRIPSGRFPEPDEIAAAVRYLISPEAVSITGHTLVVDGGLTAA